MDGYNRANRIGELIRSEVSDLLLRHIKDPRIGFCTITRVEVSGDYRHAKVFVSVMGDENQKKLTLAGLKSALGFIRREAGKRLSLRYMPELTLVLDKSLDYGFQIDKLLKELEKEKGLEESESAKSAKSAKSEVTNNGYG
jgi:ribosome-binding factor A